MSTTQSQARKAAKGVKARRMWAYVGTLEEGDMVLRETKALHCTTKARPVLVIDASPSGVAAWADKFTDAISNADANDACSYREMADAVLAAIGLPAAASLRATAKRKGGGAK